MGWASQLRMRCCPHPHAAARAAGARGWLGADPGRRGVGEPVL